MFNEIIPSGLKNHLKKANIFNDDFLNQIRTYQELLDMVPESFNCNNSEYRNAKCTKANLFSSMVNLYNDQPFNECLQYASVALFIKVVQDNPDIFKHILNSQCTDSSLYY